MPQFPTRREALLTAGAAGLLAAARARAASLDDRPAVAPAAQTANAKFYRFSVGEARCVVFSDKSGPMPATFWGGSDADNRRTADDLLRARGRATDTVTAYFHPMLIQLGGEKILIDAGNGAAEGGELAALMSRAGVAPADITALVITHLHGDHFGGLRDGAGQAAFPNARVFIQRAEAEFWEGEADLSRSLLPQEWRAGMSKAAAEAAAFIAPKAQRIGDGDRIVEGLVTRLAPGHTPGLQLLELTSGSRRLTIANDLIHHDLLSLRTPDMPLAFDADTSLAIATRKRELDRLAAEGGLVMSYHMPFPGLGRIERDGAAYRWSPEPWAWE
jgi:glyoxylase-like metal-dependent hydrolase (beta-lactamase superfamily II)